MKEIGFSTGALYKNVNPVSKEAIEIVRRSGAKAIEIGSGIAKGLSLMDKIDNSDLRGFDYVSFHAPFDSFVNNSIRVFEAINKYHGKFGFTSVVIHPEGKVNYELLSRYKIPYCFENMDPAKGFGSTVSDMKKIFANGDYSMILDLAHCYLMDESLVLAGEMQEAFRNRIKHYHLSGADKEMKNGSHHCLLQDRRQAELVGAMRLSNPIIIESVFPENKKPDELVDIMKREMEYIETKI